MSRDEKEAERGLRLVDLVRSGAVDLLSSVGSDYNERYDGIRENVRSLERKMHEVQGAFERATAAQIRLKDRTASLPELGLSALLCARQEEQWRAKVRRKASRAGRLFKTRIRRSFAHVAVPPSVAACARAAARGTAPVDALSTIASVEARAALLSGREQVVRVVPLRAAASVDDVESWRRGCVVLCPGVFRAIVHFRPVRRADAPLAVKNVAVYAWQEAVHTEHEEWGTSSVTAFERVSEYALLAAAVFAAEDERTVLSNLVAWLSSYEDLFSRPCADSGRLLRHDYSSVPLPPTFRTFHAPFTAFHRQAIPKGAMTPIVRRSAAE